jgi:hypothetical protein
MDGADRAGCLFHNSLIEKSKTPGVLELEVFGRAQVLKFSSSSETREFWPVLK